MLQFSRTRAVIFGALLALAGCGKAAAPEASGPPAAATPVPAIARVWHGRTPSAKADEYEAYTRDQIRKFLTLKGNLGYQMFRETIGDETHFMVISYWQARDNIHAYAGEDIRKVRPLPRDPEFLIDPEPTVMNYDILVHTLQAPP